MKQYIQEGLAEGLSAIGEIRTLSSALVELPEELRHRQDRQGVGYLAAVEKLGDRIGGQLTALEQAVQTQLAELELAVAERLVEIGEALT